MALLIGGHARSGTTMLRRLCHSHPQIHLTREFRNFIFVGSSFPEYSRQILKRLFSVRNRRPFDPGTNRRLNIAFVLNTIFISRFLMGIAQQREEKVTVQAVEASLKKIFPGIMIVGDKYPNYLGRLPIMAPLDGLKILIIYRDVRDVTSSFLEKVNTNWQYQKWATQRGTVEKTAAHWVKKINLMESYSDHIYSVRYEELVVNPQDIMRSVGEWLNIDPQHFNINKVRATSIGKYKSGLTNLELEAVMRIAGTTMARLGYV